MFFYLLHLYVLQGLYQACVQRWGLNQGKVFGLERLAAVAGGGRAGHGAVAGGALVRGAEGKAAGLALAEVFPTSAWIPHAPAQRGVAATGAGCAAAGDCAGAWGCATAWGWAAA